MNFSCMTEKDVIRRAEKIRLLDVRNRKEQFKILCELTASTKKEMLSYLERNGVHIEFRGRETTPTAYDEMILEELAHTEDKEEEKEEEEPLPYYNEAIEVKEAVPSVELERAVYSLAIEAYLDVLAQTLERLEYDINEQEREIEEMNIKLESMNKTFLEFETIEKKLIMVKEAMAAGADISIKRD